MDIIKVFTDGSCGKGVMGIGIYIKYKNKEIRYGKYLGAGTNQQAELHAIKESLLKLKRYRLCKILIETDSKYCIGMLSKNWKAKANQKLITSIYREMVKFKDVSFKWVKGHADNYGNKQADLLAVDARKGGSSPGDIDLPINGQIGDNFVYKTKIYTAEEISKINEEK